MHLCRENLALRINRIWKMVIHNIFITLHHTSIKHLINKCTRNSLLRIINDLCIKKVQIFFFFLKEINKYLHFLYYFLFKFFLFVFLCRAQFTYFFGWFITFLGFYFRWKKIFFTKVLKKRSSIGRKKILSPRTHLYTCTPVHREEQQ